MVEVRAPARIQTVRRESARARYALLAWGGLLTIAVIWGHVLVATRHRLPPPGPPFWSPFDPHAGPALLPATALAFIVIRRGPALAATLPWRRLLILTAAVGALWAVALAYVDGAHALTQPLTLARNDYLQTAQGIRSPSEFLGHFVDNVASYNQQTMGHPPGMIVIEWLLLKTGLASARVAAGLVLAGGVAA